MSHHPQQVALATLRRIKLRHWVQLLFKFAIVLWMLLLTFFPPVAASNLLGLSLPFIAGVTIFGAIISSAGLILSCSPRHLHAKLGVGIELSGLFSLVAGPLAYLGIQIGIALTVPGEFADRIAFCACLFVIVAALLARMAVVANKWSEPDASSASRGY